jgi:hypothetical protein
VVCTPYITPEDLTDVCELEDPRALELIDEASDVIYRLLGMAFPGVCEATVRPCRDHDCWSVGCSCGCDPDWITLPYDLLSVTWVAIGGRMLSPSEYVVRANRIALANGHPWPSTQNLLANANDPGAFAITFTHGAEPPQAVKEATIAYVAERWKAETGDPSTKLPRTVTGISRQGVNLTVNDRVEQVRTAGPTIAGIAVAMSAYNPANLRMPPDILNDYTGWTLHVDDTPLLPRAAEDEVAVGPTYIDWNGT